MSPSHTLAQAPEGSPAAFSSMNLDQRAAAILDRAHGHTSSADERQIRDLFLSTWGPDLVTLKALVDGGEDSHDLLQVLYEEVEDDGLRKEILDHFLAEAGRVFGGRRVLSDIDDTFYANLKDTRVPEKTIYPGVRAFYRGLDLGPASPQEVSARGQGGHEVTFLTARPEFMEARTHRMFADLGMRPVVVSGDLTHLLSNESMAERKWTNFLRLQAVFPECLFLWVGDSGQGDLLLGQRMRKAFPASVPGVFIHDVVATPQARREELARERIFLFDSYVGAALRAFQEGLMTGDSLQDVMDEARAWMDQGHQTPLNDFLDRDLRLAASSL